MLVAGIEGCPTQLARQQTARYDGHKSIRADN